jgi:ribosomal protein L29
MAKNIKKEEKKDITMADLKSQIAKAKEEFETMMLDNKQYKLKNTSSLTLKRKEIARMLTGLRQLELTNEKKA